MRGGGSGEGEEVWQEMGVVVGGKCGEGEDEQLLWKEMGVGGAEKLDDGDLGSGEELIKRNGGEIG